jgi:hypothetical protein
MSMNRSWPILCFLFQALCLMAQNDNNLQPWKKSAGFDYTVFEDDPTRIARLSVAFDYLYLNMGKDNIDGTGIDFGANTTFRPSNNLEINATLHLPILAMEKPASLYADANAVFYLFSKIRKRDVDVPIKYKNVEIGDLRYTSSTSVKVPGRQVLKKFGVRGGIYFRKSAYTLNSGNVSLTDGMVQAGVYSGIQFFNNVNVRIRFLDQQRQTETAAIFYVDALALSTTFNNELLSDGYKANNGTILPFGFRLGVLFRPVMPTVDSARKGFFANTEYRTEFGYRPVDGPFFNMGVGWSFYRQ